MKQGWKKVHKWPGLIVALFLIYYSISGILLNHRNWIAKVDVPRSILHENYSFDGWKNAALKGNVILSKDSIIVYGNAGIWITNSTFKHYSPFMNGIPPHADYYKTFKLLITKNNQLFAATQMGLYGYDKLNKTWTLLNFPEAQQRFVGICEKNHRIYALSRSHLFIGRAKGIATNFKKVELNAAENQSQKISLFKTIWQIHSGELFGLFGKLFVDLLGLITLILSITGIIYFIFPNWIKRRKQKPRKKLIRINRWSIKWHNYLGYYATLFLIILYFSGMFLRPPLLIAIAQLKVKAIPYSHLDQANPWHDKLRDILFDEQNDAFILATSEGLYQLSNPFLTPVKFKYQPPVSVMGITVLQRYNQHAYLIGSFSGLFLWNPETPRVFDIVKQEVHQPRGGMPIGQHKCSGLITQPNEKHYLMDYSLGARPIMHQTPFPETPQNIIKASSLSLWNLSLEIHTGRIFESLLGMFYILLVPLSGILCILVVWSGYLIFTRKKRAQRKKI